MPLPGGATDKFGNRYEGKWTVLCMLDVLEERARSIKLEPPGQEGEGVEFIVRTEAGDACHQVKRQRAKGAWSLAVLRSEGILKNFLGHLRRGARCIFVSMEAASDLRELTERAKSSNSWQECEREFLASKEWKEQFETLRIEWGALPQTDVYEFLKCVEVRTLDEQSLEGWCRDRITALMTGVPDTAADVLAQFALESVHKELGAPEIWGHLRERGHLPLGWRKDGRLRQRLREKVEADLASLEGSGITNEMLPRDEARTVLERLEEGRRVLVTGDAGCGKSGVLAQVVRQVQERGWPIIILRADRAIQADTPVQYGAAIDLPGSPAAVLAGVAAGGAALLLIDQLDAVSWASGRSPERFDLFLEITHQTRSFPNLRVLLACRQFDLDNDERFRTLAADQQTSVVKVQLLDERLREQVLERVGITSSTLTPVLKGLLGSPLHLKIYIELVKANAPNMAQMRNLKDLYDWYWDLKRQAVGIRLARKDEWMKAVELLCDIMSERQTLSVPVTRLDEIENIWKVMASEGVLVIDGKQVRFFHESLFDYAFARLFAMRDLSLESLLNRWEQGLFLRAQIRQILLHQRAEEPRRYLDNLRLLLVGDGIRLHLQLLTVAVVCSVEDPTQEEWDAVASFTQKPRDARASKIWDALVRSAAWFKRADENGAWDRWLTASDEALLRAATTTLTQAYSHSRERTVGLLRAYSRKNSFWHEELSYFMYTNAKFIPTDQKLFDILLQQIEDGAYSQESLQEGNKLWKILSALNHGNASWATKVFVGWFKRQVENSIASGSLNPFEEENTALAVRSDMQEILQPMVREKPVEFLEGVLPLFFLILDRFTPNSITDVGARHPIWSYRIFNTDRSEFVLLEALEEALKCLAEQIPDLCASYVKRLQESPWEPVYYLIASAYCGNPSFFADEAALWLCENPGALQLGYDDSPRWISRQLIEQVAKYCSDTVLARLTFVLMQHDPAWEREVEMLGRRGTSQFELLSAITDERRSPLVKRRLGELQRKLGGTGSNPPSGIQAEWVQSPIADERAAKMSDEQWLGAMLRHKPGINFRHGMIGGADELAGVLERCTGNEPERFARLLLQMDTQLVPQYTDAILMGLRKASLELDLLIRVCCHARNLGGKETGRWIAALAEQHAAIDLPDEFLQMIATIATDDPDPEQDLWKSIAHNGQPYYGGEIDTFALNCTRGRVAISIGVLLRKKPERLRLFVPALERLVQDPILAVRAATMETLLFVLTPDAELAIRLFLRALDGQDELLVSRHVEKFIYYSARLYFEDVKPVVLRMVNSKMPEVVLMGARQLTLVSYVNDHVDPLVEHCLTGSVEQRQAVAEILSSNLVKAPRQERSIALLGRLFDDESPAVREIARQCFRQLKNVPLERYRIIFESLARSRALADDLTFSLYVLSEITSRLPVSVLDVCEGWVQQRSSTQHFGTAVKSIMEIVVRVYAQYREAKVRKRCLDIIDSTLALRAYGIEEVLDSGSR